MPSCPNYTAAAILCSATDALSLQISWQIFPDPMPPFVYFAISHPLLCAAIFSACFASISFRDLLYALHNSYCSSQNFYKRMSFNYYLNTFPSRHQNSTRQITILWPYMLLPHPLQ
jgi:hypothetical protein